MKSLERNVNRDELKQREMEFLPSNKKTLSSLKRSSLLIFPIVALFIGRTQQSLSQWVQTNGPNAGEIYCLAVSPNGAGGTNLFAGTSGGGIFLSTNNGTSWTHRIGDRSSQWIFLP